MNDTLKKLIEQAVREAVAPQRWADAKTCKAQYGLTRNVLNRLAEDGEIRKSKTSDSDSAGALYRTSDIEEWMEEQAEKNNPNCRRLERAVA